MSSILVLLPTKVLSDRVDLASRKYLIEIAAAVKCFPFAAPYIC